MIRFTDIYKRFGDREILKGVSLTVQEGETLFIIGASGAGKSVLVKHLVGLLRPDSGRIELGGKDITWLSEREFYEVRMKCAMVFQNSTLFDAMNVLENVMLPIRKHLKLSLPKARALAEEKLELVGMRHAVKALPADLGDGLKKRVAIARALTLSPSYVIFDEPTTGLDPLAANQVDALIQDLAKHGGVTNLVVSHDLRSIFSVADRVAMIYEGHIRVDDTPEALKKTQDPVLRQFIEGRAEGPMR